MNNNQMNYYSFAQTSKNMLCKVFAWMGVALTLSAGVAYYVATQPVLFQTIYQKPYFLFFIFLAQLLLVIVLSAFIMKINLAAAIISFVAYALLTGLTLSSVFMVYTTQSIYTTFLTTALTFVVMALYGYFTKADLSAFGNIGLMGLFGILIGFLINFFLRSSMFDYILSVIGIFVFVLLTAYDMQKIKEISKTLAGQGELENKIAVLGALTLYLDFINLFLMMLRVMGRRKND